MMRKTLLTLTLLSLLSVIGFTQSMYWTVYHFEIKAGAEMEMTNAFDRFFNSETGKTLPYASLSANMFSSSEDKWTHSLVFATPDKDVFGEMYSGSLQQSADFALLGSTMDKSINPVASYLGKSLVADSKPENIYATVYELSVADPAAYASSFSKFREVAIKMTDGVMGMNFHQFYSGNEKDATHAVVVSAPSFSELLAFSDQVFASEGYASFRKDVKDIRKILRVFTTVQLKEYNVPPE